jgi:hypothetical protein
VADSCESTALWSSTSRSSSEDSRACPRTRTACSKPGDTRKDRRGSVSVKEPWPEPSATVRVSGSVCDAGTCACACGAIDLDRLDCVLTHPEVETNALSIFASDEAQLFTHTQEKCVLL